MKAKKKSKKSSDIINQEGMDKDNAPRGESEPDPENKKKKKKLGTTTDITTENDEKNSFDAASEKQHKSKNKKKSDIDVEDSPPTETKESKKRKRASAEDDDVEVGASLENESKHSKTEEANGEDSNARKAETKLGDSNHIDEVKDPNSGDKSTGRKSAKKPRNGSAEPTTIKAFQRVKVEEVVITDERLKDNSYWAKDGAESGYGAKAQEVLGQVRGKDFRHEKTKKKRGSYRGG
uniref:Srp40 C-terminal domain-containing protein n=1 Tax=Kalanchoe fedtschenkoi TaxID=63787 RepID=A0A7N1A936_KALFE